MTAAGVVRERRLNRRRNLRGLKSGKLTVLRMAAANVPSRSRYLRAGHTAWVCRCECGRDVVVTTNNLIRKTNPTHHCGCEHLRPVVEPRPAIASAPPASTLPVAEHTTSAQEALRRFHDEHSPLGPVRRICRPVDEDDESIGRVHYDWDPFNDPSPD